MSIEFGTEAHKISAVQLAGIHTMLITKLGGLQPSRATAIANECTPHTAGNGRRRHDGTTA